MEASANMSHKSFCVAGPIDPQYHYFVPHRLNCVDLHRLIENREYFVLHAPRQSGKTSAILELCLQLNSEGTYNAVYFNVEGAQAAREEVEKALLAILVSLLRAINNQLPQESIVIEFLREMTADLFSINLDSFNIALEYLSKHSSKPVILFLDEIDSLIGDTLLSVLRQIRAGFTNRPKLYPHSLCLIGLRDVRDYKIWSRQEGQYVSTSSPFNIKSESLILSNFTIDNVKVLYAQHTEETGQQFTPEAIEQVYYLTAGQPWLVNALGYQACYRDVTDPRQSITKEVIDRSKDALIKRRDTHIDSLLDKLHDARVRPIIEAIITGETVPSEIQAEDLQYVRDLGLVQQDKLDIANPIYREIIPQELTSVTADLITQTITPFQRSDGTLNAEALIEAFTVFYRENSAIWLQQFEYKEAGPHLLMMAFLQRVINGGGTLQREYALGTRRVDILIRWRQQTIVIELKIRHSARSIAEGLQQTADYMDTSQADEGHLVVFDRNLKKPWKKKIFRRMEKVDDKTIHLWGC